MKDLCKQRTKIVQRARSITERADRENRSPTAEERGQIDQMWSDFDRIDERLARDEKQRAIDAAFARSPDDDSQAELRAGWNQYIRGLPLEADSAEYRALAANSAPHGKYMVAPEQTAQNLVAAREHASDIRLLSTKVEVPTAESVGVPTCDTEPDDADWTTTEFSTGNEDSAMRFGKRELHPHLLAKRLKATGKLMRRSVNAERFVLARLAQKFAVAETKAHLTGDGVKKPLGVFTASDSGISTGRDVSTGSATTFTADSLLTAKFTLKEAYLRSPSLRWIFHRDAVKLIRQLKDTANQYIFQPGMAGEPDTICDIPYVLSEFAPNTFTTGLYVGVLGDLSYYWIADALQMRIQRLVELYAETDQIGYIGQVETDGMPVLEEAFIRMKTA